VRERLLLKGVGFSCSVRNRAGGAELGGELSEAIGLICDELVTNVLKYADASKVELDLEIGAQSVRLRFTDDGRGFKPRTARKSGFGLRNLSSRIRKLGGRLRVSSVPGKGSAFSIHLPRGNEP